MTHDNDGRLKRIEYRGKHLRISRTGGVSLRAQGKAAGLTFTVNSQHGMRVSTRVAKGTNVAFQNGRFVLRGRYGKGPTKLNLSKSGVSVSTKTSIGTYNWFKPRYSSAKIAGIQFRGKKAVYTHAIVGILQLAYFLALAVAQLTVWLGQALHWACLASYYHVDQYRLTHRQKKIHKHELAWRDAWQDASIDQLLYAQFYLLLFLARGSSDVQPGYVQQALGGCQDIPSIRSMLTSSSAEHEQEAARRVRESLSDQSLDPRLAIEALFGTLVDMVRLKVDATTLLETFWALDHAAVAGHERNELQESLLCTFADTCGLDTDG